MNVNNMESWIYLMAVGTITITITISYILYKNWSLLPARESDGTRTWVLRRRTPQTGKKKQGDGMLSSPVIADSAIPGSRTIQEEPTQAEPGPGTEFETVRSKADRKCEGKDYKSLFLKKGSGAKKQTYISTELYDKISKILGIIAKDISVPDYTSNILEDHLKEYKEEINNMYRNNIDLFL